MVNDNIINFIVDNLKIDERENYVIRHLLAGGKQRDCTWEGKTLNPNTVSTIRSRYIPFVTFEREGVSIVDSQAPDWLKTSDLYIPHQSIDTNTIPQNKPIKRVKKEVLDVISLKEHEEVLNATRLQLIEERKSAVDRTAIEVSNAVKESVAKQLKERYETEIAKINAENQLFTDKLKEDLRIKYTKETTELYQRQVLDAEKKVTILQAAFDKAKEENKELQSLLSQETIDKEKVETINTNLVSKNEINLAAIETLRAEIDRLKPKWDRAFVLQSLVSCGWLLGLFALSVFSIENMLIYFNAGSFWIVAVILGVFIEFMLWATNITRFAGSLDDADSEYSSKELALVIFFFRAFANSLGGYYIATNAKEFAKDSGLYANISTKFTDINELYFGWEVGGFGMGITAIIIGGFVAYMEYKALPLAIRHAYNLFIKKVD